MEDLLNRVKILFPERLHSRMFLVGGMVRDLLLGVDCQDVDLAAALSPADLKSLGFRLVESKSTPNIFFFFDQHLGKVEVTLLPSLEGLADDLRRRDFTINAMAMSFAGVLNDPLGGQRDLQDRVLRTCSATSFGDDPARIFRAFRFECDGWRLDQQAERLISSRDWSADLRKLPVERFSQEMLKALAKREPARFFRRMLQLKVGAGYLPEIFRMSEVPAGPLKYHPEGDLFTHSMQALERISLKTADLKARFCATFHDLGKLATPEDEYPRHHGHENAGALSAEPFCRSLRLPVAMLRALQATCRLHGNANRWDELKESTRIKVALGALKGGIEEILPMVVAADSGGVMQGWEEVLRIASLNAVQLGIEPELFKDPQLPVEKFQQIIMQRRVEMLKMVQRQG